MSEIIGQCPIGQCHIGPCLIVGPCLIGHCPICRTVSYIYDWVLSCFLRQAGEDGFKFAGEHHWCQP